MFVAKDRPPHDAAASRRPDTLVALATNSDPGQHAEKRPCSLTVAGVFNGLRALLPAQESQLPYYQPLPYSLQGAQNINRLFTVAYALLLRSFRKERKSTPVFSAACALFCRYTGVGRPGNMLPNLGGGHPEPVDRNSLAASPLFCALTRPRKCSFCVAFSPVFSALTRPLPQLPCFQYIQKKHPGVGYPSILYYLFSITYKFPR